MKINEDKSINQQINKCLRTSTWINIAMNILRENSSHTWPVVCQYPSWYSPWPLKDQFPNIFAPCPCPHPWEDPSSGGLEQHYRWEPWGHSYLRHSFGRWSHKWLRNTYFPLFVGFIKTYVYRNRNRLRPEWDWGPQGTDQISVSTLVC